MSRKRLWTLGLCYLHLTSLLAHNILRLGSSYEARFVLQHIDKVQSYSHFSELNVNSVQVCIDRCLANTQCRSINFNTVADANSKHQCQLVAYDRNNNHAYTDRTGWKHYDTGTTMLTRIFDTATNLCYYPESGSDCSYTSASDVELRSAECSVDNKRAYWEYDRDLGTLKHYCTGHLLCPNSFATSWVPIRPYTSSSCESIYGAGNRLARKWRITFNNWFEISGFCLGCWKLPGMVDHDAQISASYCFSTTQTRVNFPELEQGPVKATIYLNMPSVNAANYVDVIRSKGYTYIYYLNNFSWYQSYKDNYGVRLQAIFRAPETGTYKFPMGCDDFCILYIHNCITCSAYSTATYRTAPSGCFSCYQNSGSLYMYDVSMVKDTEYYFDLYFAEGVQADYLLLEVLLPSGIQREVVYSDLKAWAPSY